MSLFIIAVTFWIDAWYRGAFPLSESSSHGLMRFHPNSCPSKPLLQSFELLFSLFFLFLYYWPLFEPFFLFRLKWKMSLCWFCFNYVLQPFFSICCSDRNRTRRPDRCHVDLIATATSKEHGPQLLRGWNQGCVSFCLSGFSSLLLSCLTPTSPICLLLKCNPCFFLIHMT